LLLKPYFLIVVSINWICQCTRHTINYVQIYSRRFMNAAKDLDLHKLTGTLSYIVAVYRSCVVLPVQNEHCENSLLYNRAFMRPIGDILVTRLVFIQDLMENSFNSIYTYRCTDMYIRITNSDVIT